MKNREGTEIWAKKKGRMGKEKEETDTRFESHHGAWGMMAEVAERLEYPLVKVKHALILESNLIKAVYSSIFLKIEITSLKYKLTSS